MSDLYEHYKKVLSAAGYSAVSCKKCGGLGVIEKIYPPVARVYCDTCGYTTAWYDSGEEALEIWENYGGDFSNLMSEP